MHNTTTTFELLSLKNQYFKCVGSLQHIHVCLCAATNNHDNSEFYYDHDGAKRNNNATVPLTEHSRLHHYNSLLACLLGRCVGYSLYYVLLLDSACLSWEQRQKKRNWIELCIILCTGWPIHMGVTSCVCWHISVFMAWHHATYLICVYHYGHYQLCSAEANKLIISWSNTSFGMQRSFATFGPVVWNDMPTSMRSSNKALTTSDIRRLKTVLFWRVTVWCCCAHLCGSFSVNYVFEIYVYYYYY